MPKLILTFTNMSKSKNTESKPVQIQKATERLTPPEQPELLAAKEETNEATAHLAAALGIDYSNLTEDLKAFKQEVDAELECQAKQEKGESIHKFQEGDVIINVLPQTKVTYQSSGFYGFGGTTRCVDPDYSFRRPLQLIGVKNNIIYLRPIQKRGSDNIIGVPLDEKEDGWKIFEIPANLTMDDVCGVL